MKKLLALSAALLMFTLTLFARVNEKLLYSFNKAFPLAENVKWSEDANGYFASFTQFGILSKVVYDPHGDFIYALRYYEEDNLPVSILLKVRKRFAGKKIFGITEVSAPDNITYHVRLEDTKNWYSIAVTTSGNITLEERYQKK